VVGDSLEVLTSPYLQKYLPSASLTINAEGGYNSLQIYKLFQESYDPSQSVIVFDAGTNDNPAYPEILAGRLQAVAGQIGKRCMVVPTIHGLTVNGVNSAGKNRVVREFAASRPGTQTPEWANVVATHPELMQSDNLHPIPAGADYRARLIARGVKACLAQGSSSGLGFGQ
jgi:lysophospholipase L1-like esterase